MSSLDLCLATSSRVYSLSSFGSGCLGVLGLEEASGGLPCAMVFPSPCVGCEGPVGAEPPADDEEGVSSPHEKVSVTCLASGSTLILVSSWFLICDRRWLAMEPPVAPLDRALKRYCAASSPATRPKTTHPRRDEPPSRLAPCTPPPSSPDAQRPGMGLPCLSMTLESSSIWTPPL